MISKGLNGMNQNHFSTQQGKNGIKPNRVMLSVSSCSCWTLTLLRPASCYDCCLAGLCLERDTDKVAADMVSPVGKRQLHGEVCWCTLRGISATVTRPGHDLSCVLQRVVVENCVDRKRGRDRPLSSLKHFLAA